jgi:hypothetical protein
MMARKRRATVARSLALAMVAVGILPLAGCGQGGAGGGFLSKLGEFANGPLGTLIPVLGSLVGGGLAGGSSSSTGSSSPSFEGVTRTSGRRCPPSAGGVGQLCRRPPSGGIGVTPGPGL